MQYGPKRGVLTLGLVGVGPGWDRRYKGAVRRLAERCAIRAVFDPVMSRAQAVAQECGAEVTLGMRQLFERTDVQAVLLLDSAWYGSCPLPWCIAAQKPVFLADAWLLDRSEAERLDRLASANGVSLVPEFPHRFTPATSRLRELIATTLGPVRSVTLNESTSSACGPTDTNSLSTPAALLDWCVCVAQCDPRTLEVENHPNEHATDGWRFTLNTTGRAQISGIIRLAALEEENQASFHLELECQQGRARIVNPEELRWQRHGTEERVESLKGERTTYDVMFDQFCRRAVGGLVPVPTLTDLFNAKRLAALSLPR